MSGWEEHAVPLKFHLGDLLLYTARVPLKVLIARLGDTLEALATLDPGQLPPLDDNRGFLLRGIPLSRTLPALSRVGDYLCYVPLQYEHCYIDLGTSFEHYRSKFSSKTRSTINRKVRKFAEHGGGTIDWRSYRAPNEMREFCRLARQVAEKTYQEKLFDAGLPANETFIAECERLAAEDRVRAYVLFDRERPVSYLYCPVAEGVLVYAYLGYDPEYMQLSVGTVLQWLALEAMFDEGRFRYFDFTEGVSEHKRLFATHTRLSANVFLLTRRPSNLLVAHAHHALDRLSHGLGVLLERAGLKAAVRRLLRFGA